MAKDTFYFSHDYHARNDEKILELRLNFGAEGYGLFWMLVESMAENDNGGVKASLMGGLSLGYGVAKETLLKFVKYCIEIELFFEEDGYIFSRRMKKHKQYRQDLSESGKKGAKKRWNDGEANGEAIATLMQRKGKESKEKEIKGNISKDDNSSASADKIFDLKKIISPDSFPNWRQECINFFKNADFKKKMSKNESVSIGNIEKIMTDFLLEQDLKGQYKNEAGLISHFIHWYKKYNTSRGSSSSKGFVDVPDEYDYDKMEKW